jgi:predicted dehydrogenase
MTRLRLGLIGAGRISGSYADVLGDCESVEVVGVADVATEAASALADRLGSASYTSHLELAEDARPDAVVICTPPNTHAGISLELVARGIHVMCEKPLALSPAEAVKMLAAADENGVTLTMASKFRYVQDVVKARSIVMSGVLGEIILLENTFASRVDMASRWNSKSDVSGGGVLIDNGTHSVDVVRYFLGPIAEVMAVEGKRAQALSVEDTAQLFLRGVDGARATIDLSWSIDKERPWYLEVYGSEGTIQVGWGSSRYRQRTSSDWVEFGSGYDKTQAMHDQIANFARAIAGEEPLRITGVDALASVDVMEAAYRSLSHDNWAEVESSRSLAPA